MKYLFRPADTFFIRINKSYWAVLNPYAYNSVSVIHNKAYKILNMFPCTWDKHVAIEDLFNTAEKPIIDEMEAAGLLYTSPNPKTKFWKSDRLDTWIHITNNCNLRCRYCYISRTKEKMSEETAKKVIDTIFESARTHNYKKVMLKYAGGEALLHFELLQSMVKYADSLAQRSGIKTDHVLLSNGTIVNNKILEWLKKEKVYIMISLDGLEDYHDKQRFFPDGSGSYRHVEQTMKLFQLHGIPFNTSTTITNQNIPGIPDLVEFLLSNEIEFSLNFYRENDCSQGDTELSFGDSKKFVSSLKKAFKIIENNIPKHSLLNLISDKASFGFPHEKVCGVGENILVFDQNGNIAKCQMDIKRVVTSIHDPDPLSRIIADREGIQNLPVRKKETCSKCIWRHYCCGGCPLLTYREYEKYDVASPNCDIYKLIFPEIVKLEGLRLLKYGG